MAENIFACIICVFKLHELFKFSFVLVGVITFYINFLLIAAKKKTCKSPNTKKTKVNEYSAKDETKLEIEIDDKTYYIGIDEPLPVISKQNYELLYPSVSILFIFFMYITFFSCVNI